MRSDTKLHSRNSTFQRGDILLCGRITKGQHLKMSQWVETGGSQTFSGIMTPDSTDAHTFKSQNILQTTSYFYLSEDILHSLTFTITKCRTPTLTLTLT